MMDSSLHNSTISSAQKVAPSVKAFRLYGWKNVNRAITFFFQEAEGRGTGEGDEDRRGEALESNGVCKVGV